MDTKLILHDTEAGTFESIDSFNDLDLNRYEILNETMTNSGKQINVRPRSTNSKTEYLKL